MMDLSVTKEELDALDYYYSRKYEAMNQMLVSNCETDIALLSADVENKSIEIPYNREAIIEYVTATKLVYRLLLKVYYANYSKRELKIYRGTNISEIERIKNDIYIDRFLTGTLNSDDACNKYASVWNRPACMNITLDEEVPYIFVNEVIDGSENILISPFTRVKSIIEGEEKVLDVQSKQLKTFDVELEKQELDALDDNERFGLYNYILENAYSINHKIEECIELEEENITNFENIRKLEQLLDKYETQMEENPSEDLHSDDIERVNIELDELKEMSNVIFERKKNNINYVNMWKRNIAVYMIAECKLIEAMFDEVKEEAIENALNKKETKVEKVEESNEIQENIEDVENDNLNEEQSEEDIEEKNEEPVEEVIEETDPLFFRVKTECKENVCAAEKLLKDINQLITKQQNHAKIAGTVGASYSALNNAFEMRKQAEVLLERLNEVKNKANELCVEESKEENEASINEISKNNIEISTLINYLNNPKIAVRNSRIDRFSEMSIIEENELKRGIAERVRDLCGEAELKKLKDDLEIIEGKNSFERLIGFFTGKNKLDEFMIEQIETRQKAIRKTLSKNLGLAHNYSVHELMAEMEMFINENSDDDLIVEDVTAIRNLANELRRNFIILDSKVQSIIEEKEGRNLPVSNDRGEKISRREVIEIETYRFLNKYGYDSSSFIDSKEPVYQDTVAHEIARIIEYINVSGVL